MKLARVDLRITKADKAAIVRAAKKKRQSMASFIVGATLEKVDAVLGTIGNMK